MVQEMKSGVMAVKDNSKGSKHISLCYFTDEKSYIMYVVAAYDNDKGYKTWAQYELEQAAIDEYNFQYDKIFG